MKKIKIIGLLFMMLCFMLCLISCGNTDDKSKDIEIIKEDKKTHYIKFIENQVEVLRIVVLENETYEDLLPYFPTLTEEDGYIKYWDGDYSYTTYDHNNQFQVYNDDIAIIEIYSYKIKAK